MDLGSLRISMDTLEDIHKHREQWGAMADVARSSQECRYLYQI